MSTRSRRRSASSDEDLLDDEFSFVTEDDIEAFMATQEIEEESEAKAGFWNVQTASGIGLIGLGGLYSLQLMGLLSIGSGALAALVQVLPVFAAILIMLTGFGVLSWSPAARRQRKARRRAARRRANARKTMGRQARQKRVQDAAGRRASKAFNQAERAVRSASREAKKRTSSRTRRSREERRGRRLTKRRSERKISGVAAGVADYFGLDPTIVRIAFVVGLMATQGAALLLYIILAFALPNEDANDRDDDPVIQIIDD
ncbi:MAG: PspC domain-containing protein [Rubricoccaceae bacterium]